MRAAGIAGSLLFAAAAGAQATPPSNSAAAAVPGVEMLPDVGRFRPARGDWRDSGSESWRDGGDNWHDGGDDGDDGDEFSSHRTCYRGRREYVHSRRCCRYFRRHDQTAWYRIHEWCRRFGF